MNEAELVPTTNVKVGFMHVDVAPTIKPEVAKAWATIMENMKLKIQKIGSDRDGTKHEVMGFFKLFEAEPGIFIPQVQFRYGQRWYRFDLVPMTKDDYTSLPLNVVRRNQSRHA